MTTNKSACSHKFANVSNKWIRMIPGVWYCPGRCRCKLKQRCGANFPLVKLQPKIDHGPHTGSNHENIYEARYNPANPCLQCLSNQERKIVEAVDAVKDPAKTFKQGALGHPMHSERPCFTYFWSEMGGAGHLINYINYH